MLKRLSEKMPVAQDAVLLGSLIQDCEIHENVERCERLMKYLKGVVKRILVAIMEVMLFLKVSELWRVNSRRKAK